MDSKLFFYESQLSESMLLFRNAIDRLSIVFRFRLIHLTSSSAARSPVCLFRLMETQKTYQPSVVENSQVCAPLWRETLKSRKISKNKREEFSMILPPPNITGDLHLGHALTVAIEDAICRWQFMQGKNVTWIPGLDHAGLATEMVVERHLANQAVSTTGRLNPRQSLGREAFIEEIWRWKELKKNTISDQLNRLGLLLDWNAEYFTFSREHNEAVNEALFRLSKAGLLYRTKSLISWCCYLQSAISDVEVEHKEITKFTMLHVPGYTKKQAFGYVDVFDYKLLNGRGSVSVATTRLETMLGDTALAVHPEDSRFAHLIGEFVEHPFIKDRVIPIIANAEHVDPRQGTGVVKVSPGHSMVDFDIAECGRRLEVVNILGDNGNLLEVCGEFAGLSRFEARSSLVRQLTVLGLYRGRFNIGEATDFLAPVNSMSLPICSRSGDIIEPLLREQWFINTTTMTAGAAEANKSGALSISPQFYEAAWREWLVPERRRDWCISRQVWWGHRMPAYRIPEGLNACTPSVTPPMDSFSTTSDWVIARDLDEARKLVAEKCNCSINEVPTALEQDADVLDTWFSSALLPLTVFGWPQNRLDPYTLDLMETGQDILFFWVARMVMLGIHFTGKVPFKHVLLHGLICDASGKKMSKSKGNTIDPLSLIDGIGSLKPSNFGSCDGDNVRTLGADAMRASLLATDFTRPATVYTEGSALDFRRFGNKVWQSMRFLISEMTHVGLSVDLRIHSIENMWDESLTQKVAVIPLLDEWILQRVTHLARRFNKSFAGLCSGQDCDEALHKCVSDLRLWWIEDFCSVYLEVVKHRLRKSSGAKTDLDIFLACFLCGLRLLHPLMPHLSEVLWQALLNDGRSILLQHFPKSELASISDSSSFMVDALASMSRLKSWLVLLGLKRADSSSVGVLTDVRQETAIAELCTALVGLRRVDAASAHFTSIPCGTGVSLGFNPRDVNFNSAEQTLRSRLSKLAKKAEALQCRTLKENESDGELSRTEASKLVLLERQISDLTLQLQTLLDCSNCKS